MRRPRTAAALAAATLAAALTGCTATPAPVVHTSTPAAAAPAPAQPPAPTPTVQTVAERCASIVGDGGQYNYQGWPAYDLGPRAHAHGTVTDGKGGHPTTYTVAPDDAESSIADRLCIPVGILWGLNPIIRCHGQAVQPGQVLEVDPDGPTGPACHYDD